jgi:hypothetical protein
MGANGNGNGNGGTPGNGAEGERAKITFEEARAAMGPPRDRVDQVVRFAADQSETLSRAIAAQARAMAELSELINERFRNVEAEVSRLRALLRDRRADMGDESEDTEGSGLQ